MSLKRSGLMCCVSAIALSSCAQQPQDSASTDATSEEAARAPDIEPTAAPSVAFAYNYSFQLPDSQISAVQEGHARACEQLGVSKCRITGMTYGVDEREGISATLTVKLEPAIARAFGKDAWKAVEKSDGRLVNLAIRGDDVGTEIDVAQKRQGELDQRIAELEKRLATLPAYDPARAGLIQQIEALKDERGGQDRTVDASKARLANTPMTFDYYGSGGVPGFRGNPVREAWHLFVGTVVVIAGFLLRAIAVVVPLGLLFALLLLLWRSRPIRAVRGWISKREPDSAG